MIARLSESNFVVVAFAAQDSITAATRGELAHLAIFHQTFVSVAIGICAHIGYIQALHRAAVNL